MSGVTDPAALVQLRGGLKVSTADLTEALTGRFTEHHAFMTRLLLNRIDQHTAAINHLEQRIEQKINSVPPSGTCSPASPGSAGLSPRVALAVEDGATTLHPTPRSAELTSGVPNSAGAGRCPSSNRRRTELDHYQTHRASRVLLYSAAVRRIYSGARAAL
jgi:transposase